jgi:hypothetical protein
LFRFFGNEFGTQISWLIPAAVILGAASLWLWRRRPRADPARSAVVLWAGWLAVTVVVISLAKGIIHPYYSVAAAPAIGALVGIGSAALWQRRAHLGARLALAVALATTVVWGYVLLDRAPQWMPWLRAAALAVGLAAAALVVFAPRLRRRGALALGAAGICAALAGPAAYALDTVTTAHAGAIPSAGPTSGVGRNGLPGRAGARPGFGFPRAPGGVGGAGALGPGPGNPGGVPTGSFPPGGFGGPPGAGVAGGLGAHTGPGGGGGFLSISTPGSALVKALETGAGRYTWVAATVNSNSAAGYQLATGDPVMAIGGFNGTDPAPTLAQFERDVAQKKVHYFISGGRGLGSANSATTAGQITQWVESHFTATTLGGVTLYDLTSAAT